MNIPALVMRKSVAIALIALASGSLSARVAGSFTPSVDGEKRTVNLEAAEVVRVSLSDNLNMRTAVSSLVLGSQTLAEVFRKEFTPKLSTTVGTQRSLSALDGASQFEEQDQTSLALNWRLRSGGNVRINHGLTRSLLPGPQASRGRATGISLTQPLLRGAGPTVAEAGLARAESAFRIDTRGVTRTAQILVAQALDAYVGLQQSQAASAQAKAAFDLAERLHAFNQAMVAAGRLPRNVLLQSESDVSAARLDIGRAENFQRQATRALAIVMGRSNLLDGYDLVLADPFGKASDEMVPEEQAFLLSALQASTELFAARESIVQAELALALARDGLLPSLALSVGSTLSSGNVPGSQVRDSWVALNFEYTFDRAPLKIEKGAAQINLDTAKERLEITQQEIRDAASDALRNYSFALAQRELARTSLKLAEQQLDAEVTRQNLGRASQLELSTAQQSLAAANRQLLDAEREVFRGRVEMAILDGSLLQIWGVQPIVDEWLANARRGLGQ